MCRLGESPQPCHGAKKMAPPPEMSEKSPLDEKTKRIRDGDLVISSLFILGSLWTAYESLRMSYERYSQGLATLYTVPGLSPLIISLCILGCSVVVLVNAIRVGGDLKFLALRALKRTFSNIRALTPTIIVCLLCIYVFIFVERFPFSIATFIFIIIFMSLFRAARVYWIILIAALYSVAIVYFFSTVVGTRFPVSLFLG
jgi:hypothetical protein